MVNRLVNLEETTDSLSEMKLALQNRNNQTNKVDLTNINNELKYIRSDIESIQEALRNLYDNQEQAPKQLENETIDLSPFEEKITAIEKKLYELLSGELTPKPSPVIKKQKVAKEQIALFANDLTPLEELKKAPAQEETNFANFAKEESKPITLDGQEIIRHEVTPHSQLVITKKITPPEEKKEVEKLVVNEEQEEKKEASFNCDLKDAYSLYDIKVIERIMNNALKPEERNEANRVKELWNNLEKIAAPSEAGIASTLKLGKVTAVSSKEIVITYSDYASCNRIMRPSFKNKALHLLYDLLGDIYQYIALPEDIWASLRKEFIGQYSMGIRPLLSPLDPKTLSLLQIKDDYQDPKDEVINKTLNFFGQDLIEIE